jgi:hypothetical protein
MPITINLDGPQGNAFALMGIAKNLAKQLGWEPSRIDLLINEMKSSDYDHLIAVFLREFDSLVHLTAGGFSDDGEDDYDDGDED